MADKNAKAELNVEDLEGVAGGKMTQEELLRQGNPGPNPLETSIEFSTEKMTQEELLRQGGTDGNRIHKPLINVEVS